MATKKTKEPIDNYAEDSELAESYREQQKLLDSAKRKEKQSADISYRTLQKYLPVQNKMNGMSGLGVSESATIEANNRYVSRMGEIDESHAAASAALLNNYRTDQKNEQDAAYATAREHIESGAITTGTDLDRYLTSMEGNISNEQMELLTQYGNQVIPRVKRTDESSGAIFRYTDGTVRTHFNGAAIEVDSNNKVTDSNIISAARDVANNETFMIGDKIYFKMDGEIYTAETKDYDLVYKKFYPQ